MGLNSIRWRLPFSYGGIALLSILSLSAFFLTSMRNYYLDQELNYLNRNAGALAEMLTTLLGGEIEDGFVQSQVEIYAYWTQTQIKVFDWDGILILDSGLPGMLEGDVEVSYQLKRGDASQSFQQVLGAPGSGMLTHLVLQDPNHYISVHTEVQGALDALGQFEGIGSLVSGFNRTQAVDQGPGNIEINRSAQNVRHELPNMDGYLPKGGWIELSNGPAFGRAVMDGAIRGFLFAGISAVFIATLIGWLMSLRLSRPIHALVISTEKMASGDLGVRSAVVRQDEIGRLAVSFNYMAEQIEQMVRTLVKFFADAAHEINTPLTALRTNIELASQSPDEIQFVNILDQLDRLDRLSDDLLQLARLEGGVSRLEQEQVFLIPLLQEISETYASRADQAGLDFQLSFPSGNELTVFGDHFQIRTAVENLLENAVKFTPEGGTVRVSLEKQAQMILLHVEDTGIGILEADLDQLFQRFHRGQNASSYPGSGLGLAISQTIIKQHQGEIRVVRKDRGSRFTISLPANG